LLNLYPLISAFLIISAAELGDKTQLLTIGFAAKYPVWEIILAVFSASAVLMGIAVVFGGLINQFIPLNYIQILAGILFILFGIWNFLGKEEKEEEVKKKAGKSSFWIIFGGFFLAELGDKTQLMALAISAKGAGIQVWIGATLAMVFINSFGIFAGGWLKKHVPALWIKIFGTAVFILFGLWTLGENLLW